MEVSRQFLWTGSRQFCIRETPQIRRNNLQTRASIVKISASWNLKIHLNIWQMSFLRQLQLMKMKIRQMKPDRYDFTLEEWLPANSKRWQQFSRGRWITARCSHRQLTNEYPNGVDFSQTMRSNNDWLVVDDKQIAEMALDLNDKIT